MRVLGAGSNDPGYEPDKGFVLADQSAELFARSDCGRPPDGGRADNAWPRQVAERSELVVNAKQRFW
jgi:hypothetical protein